MTLPAMILLDIDPNVVKPGWTPLLILIAIAVAMVFLFLSMRKQFRKINARTYDGDSPRAGVTEDAASNAGPDPRV